MLRHASTAVAAAALLTSAAIAAAEGPWNAYLFQLMDDNALKSGGIYGLDGQVLAARGQKLPEKERAALAALVREGKTAPGAKFMLNADELTVGPPLADGLIGACRGDRDPCVTIKKTGKAFILAILHEGLTSDLTRQVQRVGDRMIADGF